MRPVISSRGSIVVTFGRHKGKDLASLADSYLQWMAQTLQQGQGQCALWGALAQQILDEKNKSKKRLPLDLIEEWGAHQELDASSYAVLVRKAGGIEEGRRLHARIVENGLIGSSVYLENLLIEMYKKWGEVDQAWAVFLQMPRRNLFSWNIAMSAANAAQRSSLQKTRSLFHKMPAWDVVSWNVMITAFAQKGHLQQAEDLFTKLAADGGGDRVSCNAMIGAYARRGHTNRAMELFALMELEGIYYPPDVLTLVSVFDACGASNSSNLSSNPDSSCDLVPNSTSSCSKSRSKNSGRLLHRELLEMNLLPLNVVVGNSIISMYSRCGEIEDAKAAFDDLRGRDVISWNAMVAACINNGRLEQAMTILGKTACHNVVSWNAAIAASSRLGDLEGARAVFETVPRRDVVTWNAMLSACVRCGASDVAVQLWREMDCEADSVTLTTMLDACACLGLESLGMTILNKLKKKTMLRIKILPELETESESGESEEHHEIDEDVLLEDDVVVGNAVIKFHTKCGNLREAKVAFEEMNKRHLDDVVSWSSMISAHAQNGGSVLEALELLRGMVSKGIHPNKVTSMSLLSVCSHAGCVDIGCSLFVSLEADFGIPVSLEHYICMIDLLGRAGEVKAAKELVHTMPFEADDVALRALISACTTM